MSRAMRTLLIDGQATTRGELRELLKAHPAIDVVGEADSFASARRLLGRDDYGLVFLDVDLVGGTGFELMADVRAGARVIFATEHDGFALRAFEVNALDYLLKPVRASRLALALGRLTLPAAALPARRSGCG
jgi:two-component system LytT family response regulator